MRDPALDIARGVAVVLVVFMHADNAARSIDPTASQYAAFNWASAVIRMPLLMLVSGFLVSHYRHGATTRLIERALHFAWLYVVWFAIEGASGMPGRTPLDLLDPFTPLWFLLALLLFTAAIPLVRRVPAWAVIAVATGVALALYSGTVTASLAYDRIGRTAPFFYLGFFHPGVVRRSTAPLRAQPALAMLAALVVVHAANIWSLRALGWQVFGLPDRLACCVIALAAAGQIARMPLAGAVLEWVGRNTLPIFVGHMIVQQWSVAAIAATFGRYGAPIALTLVSVVATLLFHRVAMNTGLRVLYERPRWLRLPVPHRPPHAAALPPPTLLPDPARA